MLDYIQNNYKNKDSSRNLQQHLLKTAPAINLSGSFSVCDLTTNMRDHKIARIMFKCSIDKRTTSRKYIYDVIRRKLYTRRSNECAYVKCIFQPSTPPIWLYPEVVYYKKAPSLSLYLHYTDVATLHPIFTWLKKWKKKKQFSWALLRFLFSHFKYKIMGKEK